MIGSRVDSKELNQENKPAFNTFYQGISEKRKVHSTENKPEISLLSFTVLKKVVYCHFSCYVCHQYEKVLLFQPVSY